MADNEIKCNCGNNAKDHLKQIEEESFAMTLLKECSKMSKRWFFTAMIILAMWLMTISGFVWYLNQYDFANYDISTDGGGNVNYSNNGGNINNGSVND